MTNLKEFLKSCEDLECGVEEVKIFYRSIRKTVILSYFDKRALRELFELEEKCQWPLLQRIAEQRLPLCRDADNNLLDALIKSINDENALREEKSRMKTDAYWLALFDIIVGRIEIFKAIFGYCKKDVKRCAMIAERYKRLRQRKIENTKKVWKFFIGSGAAALAGSVALVPVSLRTPKCKA